MYVKLTDEQNDLVKNIALREGFTEYELEAKSGSMKGDGFLGIITSVIINNDERILNLVLKSAQTGEELRKKAPIRQAYLREIFVYEKIFPEFDKFQTENNVTNGFSGFAKIYGSCDKETSECLVLENLREVDFKLWNKKIPMNSKHVALVFAEYGKLHAISLAMKDKKPTEYKKLTENLQHLFKMDEVDERMKHVEDFVLESGSKAVKGDQLATEAMKRFSTKVRKFFTEDFRDPENQIVITHGDCWCNNMMFKYEDSKDPKKPTKVCFLDWQLSNLSSPVLDLAYFFFVCSSKKVLYDYDKYLKIYHDSVSESLRAFSCDAESIFPFSLLKAHWQKYAKFGLFMALMIIKIMVSEADEVPDFQEVSKTGDTFFDGVKYSSVNDNEYNQRIIDIVNFMAEHDLI